MVKRIKKRIPKQDDELETGEGTGEGSAELDDAPPPGDLRAELQSLAEDDFTRKVAGGFQWMMDKRYLLVGVGAVAIIGVFAYAMMHRTKESATQEAAAAFYDAARTYIDAQGGEEATAPGVAPAPALSAEERNKRVSKAAAGFEATKQAYGDKKIAVLATLGQAGAQVDLGKPKDAVALYDAVLADATTERLARATALQGKATALEAAGDAAAARAAWGELGALDPQAYGLMAGLQAGRLLEKMGKTAEARSHYEKLQKDFDAALGEFAGRAYKAEIERRLGQLGDAS
ncbi:MAG: tetratricopeptide repeat protein [Myxococcales bacterium]|nr:tetratricopeptide repeat protein [Myxococcales bacterium]